MRRRFAFASSAILPSGACQSGGAPTDNVVAADVKPDPRQGKEARQICFNQQIRNWRENDNKSVIVEKV
ncbi:MAG: hypothetical protein Q8R02_19275 [Hyphomonadaceae bacterium]|nr:hypothetical protein [Hyphomonadaceae bacterium]